MVMDGLDVVLKCWNDFDDYFVWFLIDIILGVIMEMEVDVFF